MIKRIEDEMRQAERRLVDILENVGPYIRRPVVKEYSTRGRWTLAEPHSAEERLSSGETKSINDLFA